MYHDSDRTFNCSLIVQYPNKLASTSKKKSSGTPQSCVWLTLNHAYQRPIPARISGMLFRDDQCPFLLSHSRDGCADEVARIDDIASAEKKEKREGKNGETQLIDLGRPLSL
jgi:hypothetical protein